MLLIVKLISAAIIVFGCFLMLRPKTLKKVIGYVKEGKRMYVSAFLKVVLGILLMLQAAQCRVEWIVLLVGVISAVSGVLTFVIKKEIVLSIMNRIETISVKTVYFIGIICLALGVVLVMAI